MPDRNANSDLRQRQAVQRQRFNVVAAGTLTLVAGAGTVTSREVPSEGGIVLTRQEGASPGSLRVSARTFGLSFTVASSNAADVGDVFWMIVK